MNLVTKYREARGMSTRQFAQAAGLSQSIVHRYETGESKLSVGSAKKIAKVLNRAWHTLMEA